MQQRVAVVVMGSHEDGQLETSGSRLKTTPSIRTSGERREILESQEQHSLGPKRLTTTIEKKKSNNPRNKQQLRSRERERRRDKQCLSKVTKTIACLRKRLVKDVD